MYRIMVTILTSVIAYFKLKPSLLKEVKQAAWVKFRTDPELWFCTHVSASGYTFLSLSGRTVFVHIASAFCDTPVTMLGSHSPRFHQRK